MLKVERAAGVISYSWQEGIGSSISVQWLAFNWSTVSSLIKTGGKSKYMDTDRYRWMVWVAAVIVAFIISLLVISIFSVKVRMVGGVGVF